MCLGKIAATHVFQRILGLLKIYLRKNNEVREFQFGEEKLINPFEVILLLLRYIGLGI